MVIAAFDFDKTLTTRDSFIVFLWFSTSIAQFIKKIFLLTPSVIAYIFGRIGRQELKEKALTLFFKGKSVAEMETLATQFAKEKLPFMIRQEAIERLSWHQEQGHSVVLVSASPEIYLLPWAKKALVSHVLASRLQIVDGKITGKLDGVNCRGEEKVRRLEEAFGPLNKHTVFAYGDSEGDKELLKIAKYPYYRHFSGACHE